MHLPFEGKLSGQYTRADLILWKSFFRRPKFCLSSQDIATEARIPKSTLSTLLETARTLGFVTQQEDPKRLPDCALAAQPVALDISFKGNPPPKAVFLRHLTPTENSPQPQSPLNPLRPLNIAGRFSKKLATPSR